jgi:hypothetical protein
MIWIPTFKSTVFELLEAYKFQKCSSFISLLEKWHTKIDPDRLQNMPLPIFFRNTEPNTNKIPFYEAAFEYYTNINLAEFLAVSIGNGELSDNFITSLKKSRPF